MFKTIIANLNNEYIFLEIFTVMTMHLKLKFCKPNIILSSNKAIK